MLRNSKLNAIDCLHKCLFRLFHVNRRISQHLMKGNRNVFENHRINGGGCLCPRWPYKANDVCASC